nr:YHYH domain-containing protein [Pseudoxanthomonas taiwanensis]
MLLVVLLAPLAPLAQAHPGGLNAEGCHHDRRNGGYHCHRAPAGNTASQAQSLQAPARAAPANGRAFRNCAEARAAGAARCAAAIPATACTWTATTTASAASSAGHGGMRRPVRGRRWPRMSVPHTLKESSWPPI